MIVYISKTRDFYVFYKYNGMHYSNMVVYAVLSLLNNLLLSNEYIKLLSKSILRNFTKYAFKFVVEKCRSPPGDLDFTIQIFRRFYYV